MFVKDLAVLLLVTMNGLQLIWAQGGVTDCTDISIGLETMPIDPVTVPDLPVCTDLRNVAQCCSTQYIIDQSERIEQLFLEGLRIELHERFQDFDTIVDQLRAFIEGDFITGFFRSFGSLGFGRGANDRINQSIAELQANFEFVRGEDEEPPVTNTTSGFSIRRLIGNLASGIADATFRQLVGRGVYPRRQQECARQVIESHIQQLNMGTQAEVLQQIRRVLASVEYLRSFVQNLTNDLAGFRPLQQCINTLVQLNTCGRCMALRPPFCQNVCAAITRACYSPFNDALRDQLEQLWEVVKRILDVVTDTISDINASRRQLKFNRTAIISQISTECNIEVGPRGPRKERQSGGNIPLLPSVIRTAARSLRGGPFAYNGRGRLGPGLCRLLNTSRGNCWDGNRNTTEDTDVTTTIITIPDDQLVAQAASLGTPVSTALNDPSFVQVAPLGLVLPESGEQVITGEGGQVLPGGGTSGAAMLTVFYSFSSFVLLIMVGNFVLMI